MRKSLGKAVAVVLPILPSYARNRMVQMGIPFIVPGNQVFLPGSVIDLREHFPQANPKKREWLGPAAQCTVLFHLLRTPLQGISLKDISGKLEYSTMMLTKVKDELEASGLCKTVRNGRSLIMEFAAHGRSLWELALPHLRSPVKKTHWVQWRHPGPKGRLAGMSALSRQTAITDDRLPTYALTHSAFQGHLKQGYCVGCQDAEDATAKIELWSYPPERLANSETVDPLSLLLSLRNSADERVQQQLEQIIQDIKW
jgi:DNA-binding MarR family transcriptional regulator